MTDGSGIQTCDLFGGRGLIHFITTGQIGDSEIKGTHFHKVPKKYEIRDIFLHIPAFVISNKIIPGQNEQRPDQIRNAAFQKTVHYVLITA